MNDIQLTFRPKYLIKFYIKMYLYFCRLSNRKFCTIRFTGNSVRRTFLDFFIREKNHNFIRSSPVIPYCDPTLAFVNAGMNQFKGVFLGKNTRPCLRAANSQKCIRVGGKHNDLDVVGTDGYHHTFFEMLGNWSFGDYYKKEACEMAWDLLTKCYGLSPNQLYVTYFGGEETLSLEADLETYDIWRQMGLSKEHIIPFGSVENFWEMGHIGPCGPCTEIHIDHIPGRSKVADRVNQGYDDLTELWNIVFMQYNREDDGTLKNLSTHHVDTGMGFERLVAVLQTKQCNYDTDLFTPLLQAIEKLSGAPPYGGKFGKQDQIGMDTAYRIISDHIRMITVALADGMFPAHNLKLRRIIRRALITAENNFRMSHEFLSELANHVGECLHEAYPEIGEHIQQVHIILNYEGELLKSLRSDAALQWRSIVENKPELENLNILEMPGLVAGFNELEKAKSSNGELPTDIAFKLYDTYGLSEEATEKLLKVFGHSFDAVNFSKNLQSAKLKSRSRLHSDKNHSLLTNVVSELVKLRIKPTEDSYKYKYFKNDDGYIFPEVECEIKAIVFEQEFVEKTEIGKEYYIIFDRTNLYSSAGGQESDSGYIITHNNNVIDISTVINIQGYVFHKVYLKEKNCSDLCIGDMLKICINQSNRLDNMRNHTATHLINASLRKILTVTCQNSSYVCRDYLNFEFASYGKQIDLNNITTLEDTVKQVIKENVPVIRRTVSVEEFLSLKSITLFPGEVYTSESLHVIQVDGNNLISREACCGTHVAQTGDIDNICVIALKSAGTGAQMLKAVTGIKAHSAEILGKEMLQKVKELVKSSEEMEISVDFYNAKIKSFKKELKDLQLPHIVSCTCLKLLDDLTKFLKEKSKFSALKSMEREMQQVLEDNSHPFVIHCLADSFPADSVSLQKVTRLCPDQPIIVIYKNVDLVKARCCVPSNFITTNFDAEKWMKPVLRILKATGFVPRGQNASSVFNMKAKKIPNAEVDLKINLAIDAAKYYAENALRCENHKHET